MGVRCYLCILLLFVWFCGTEAYPREHNRDNKRSINGICPSKLSDFREVVLKLGNKQICHQCGQHCCFGEKNKRIIHGSDAMAGEFPWHAAIFQRDENSRGWKLLCGGVLVTPQHVLTAAHCFWKQCNSTIRATSKWRVSIGEVHINFNSDGVRMDSNGLLEFEEVQCHRNYRQRANGLNEYDVALIRLSEKSYHPTVCISMDEFNPSTSNNCFGIGHGKTSSAHNFGSSRLQKVRTNILSLRKCESIYGEDFKSLIHACATTANHGTYVGCNMDSGSPIVCPQDPNDACSPYVVYGLFSNKLRDADCHDSGASIMTNMFSIDGWTPLSWVSFKAGIETTYGCDYFDY